MSQIRILGICFDVYITSACVIEDGRVVAACPEERLSREKLTKSFPSRAIRYCLERAGCSLAEVDYVAVGWNPGVHAAHLNPRFSSTVRWRAEQLYAIPNFLLSMQGGKRVHRVLQHLHDYGQWYSDRFVEDFGPPRTAADELGERHYQIAHALQHVTEEALAHLLRPLHRRTGEERLVVSGGTFMNSVFNGKVTEMTPFKEVFIPSCPDDSGVSIGAALHAYHDLAGGAEREVMLHNYDGPAFSDDEIVSTLNGYKLRYRMSEDVSTSPPS